MRALKLLILRAVPLLLRPAVILLEGTYIATGSILVLALPLAMMALTISSIPVHLDYFRSKDNHPDRDRLAQEYVSGLTWLCLISLIILATLLALLPLGLSGIIVAATCMVFLTEKLADEASRMLEFRKAFVKWCLVQTLRSGWMGVPIALAMSGLDYETAFLLLSIISAALMFLLYLKVVGLTPRLTREGFAPIRSNLVFLVGSVLPASYQQLPRLAIAKLFPDQAHIYLAMAQMAQGVGLIFAVRFQIPYRRTIALKPITFQRRLKPTMLLILLPSALIAIAYLLMSTFYDMTQMSNGKLASFLAPVVIANALVFSIQSAYLGYIRWFAPKTHVFAFYVICVALGVLIGAFVNMEMLEYISLPGIPALTMVVGFLWLFLAMIWFFPSKARDV